MRLLKTTLSLLALGLCIDSTEAEASSTERELDSIIVFGAISCSTPYTDPKSRLEELGILAITDENKSAFQGLPLVGTSVSYTDSNKTIYEKVAYTQDRFVMETGKTYGVVPLLKGEDKSEMFRRMRLPELSFMNVK